MVNELKFKRPMMKLFVELWLETPDKQIFWLDIIDGMWRGSDTMGSVYADLCFDDLTEEEQYKVCEWLVR